MVKHIRITVSSSVNPFNEDFYNIFSFRLINTVDHRTIKKDSPYFMALRVIRTVFYVFYESRETL